MPKEARKKAEAELKKLKLMSPMSAEATVVRNFIDTLVALPWKKKSRISADLVAAEKVLNEDHYGLEKVKERIVEYLAVQQRVDKLKAPILCLVGAPGVGKTSLGQSIARATNASSCGCRWAACATRPRSAATGALHRLDAGQNPARHEQGRSAQSVVPALHEVDKMGMDFRGDPASALLECSIPSKTTLSSTITSRSDTTSRT